MNFQERSLQKGPVEKLGISQRRIRILSDGRHVPTFEGLKHTPETIEKMRAARIGKRKSEEYVHRRSDVWNQVRPFFVRRLRSKDIACFTGLDSQQVKNSIYSSKTSLVNNVEAFTPEEVKERKRKSGAGQPLRLIDRPPITEDEKNNIELVKKFVADGLFTDDLSYWETLRKLYAKYGRNLPESSAEMLRLEIFVSARQQAENGDRTMLEAYIRRGEEIDKSWFINSLRDEQEFITEKLMSTKIEEDDLLEQIFHKHRELLPTTKFDRNYILALWKARKLWSEKGERSLIDNFPKTYKQQDPTIARRLRQQIEVIQKQTPISTSDHKKTNGIHGMLHREK